MEPFLKLNRTFILVEILEEYQLKEQLIVANFINTFGFNTKFSTITYYYLDR